MFPTRPFLPLTAMCLMSVASAAMLLPACSLSAPYPDRALFTLSSGDPPAADAPADPPPSAPAISLRVRRILAVPPFGATAFVYRTGPNQLQTDYYDAFAAPPAELVTADLERWLRETNLFAAVIDSNSSLSHQWALEGRLQELAIDTTKPSGPAAVLRLQLVLLDEQGVIPRPLFDRTYAEEVPLHGSDARAAAVGWSAACRQAFTQFTADLSRIAAEHPPARRPD